LTLNMKDWGFPCFCIYELMTWRGRHIAHIARVITYIYRRLPKRGEGSEAVVTDKDWVGMESAPGDMTKCVQSRHHDDHVDSEAQLLLVGAVVAQCCLLRLVFLWPQA
jgi:hypothetical protein